MPSMQYMKPVTRKSSHARNSLFDPYRRILFSRKSCFMNGSDPTCRLTRSSLNINDVVEYAILVYNGGHLMMADKTTRSPTSNFYLGIRNYLFVNFCFQFRCLPNHTTEILQISLTLDFPVTYGLI
ncbi:hypothetical protein TNCV_2475681 [Trichonephila clavipes]|nr:hypothetical protein TNCV_2475681 [Trichonephila clavipes]